jgi:hypothetical protein
MMRLAMASLSTSTPSQSKITSAGVMAASITGKFPQGLLNLA